jgi:ribosomal protein L11 methyltransferase
VLDLSRCQWVSVRVAVPCADADVAAGLLWSAGVAGIEERPCSTGGGGERLVELVAGLAGRDLPIVESALGQRWPFEALPVEGDDWLDAWRAWARPWRAGSRLVVVPAWVAPPSWVGPDDVVVALDPGRAFGSGAHATTRLCLAELESRVRPGDRVLDVGCGSGVLSVAAARLGAVGVTALDIDPEAVRATAENAERNGVGEVVHPALTPVDELAAQFDCVVANIGAATLVGLAGHLADRVEAGGVLVLSGVLVEQVSAVNDAVLAAGLVPAGTGADGEWRALAFCRPG